jgi:hypothetical protein
MMGTVVGIYGSRHSNSGERPENEIRSIVSFYRMHQVSVEPSSKLPTIVGISPSFEIFCDLAKIPCTIKSKHKIKN